MIEMSVWNTVFIFLIFLLLQSSAFSSDDLSDLNSADIKQLSDTNNLLNATKSLNEIGGFLFSILQVIFALLAFVLVAMFIYWIRQKDGMLIYPFETVNCKEEYNGKAVSELLIAELQRIKHITSTGYEGIENERTKICGEKITGENALGTVNLGPSSSSTSITGEKMPQIGTIGLGPSTISIGELMTTIKQILRGRDGGSQVITGSLEKHGSNIKLVACLMGSNPCAWTTQTQTVKKLQRDFIDDFDRVTESPKEDIFIHDLVRDLSFEIAYHLSQKDIAAKTVTGFRCYTDALDNYQQYVATREIDFLNLASKNCIMASKERNYKKTISLFLNLGNAYLNEKMYDKAEKILNNIIFELDPEHAEAWNAKGVALHHQCKYEDAIQAYDRAIKLYPNHLYKWNAKGAQFDAKGLHEDAFKAYREANKWPNYMANAWNNKGLAFLELGEYDKAIQAFDKATELDPELALAWNYKGLAFLNQGEYYKAIQAFDKAIELDPKLAMAWNNKGYAFCYLGEHDKAIQAFDKAIELDPKLAMAWNNRGFVLFNQGENNKAIQSLDKAIELDPKLVSAWSNKGFALLDQGENNKANKAFDKVIELDPNQAMAWKNKGFVLFIQGENNKAIQSLDKAIELDPKLAVAWNYKSLALRSLGRTTEANAAFAKARELGYTD